jgi:hypothetical protein
MGTLPKIIHPDFGTKLLIRKVLRVSDDINLEFKRQASLYGTASAISAESKRNVRRLKDELEAVKSRIRRAATHKHSDSRLTKDFMQAVFMRKKSYKRKMEELNEAIYYEDLITGLLRALEHKKDALVGLGANYRHELPDELRMLSSEMKRRRSQRKKGD